MNEKSENTVKTHEIIISVTAILLLGLLFFITELFKSPFIILGVIIFLVYPYRKSSLPRLILIASVSIFVLWFLHSIAYLLFPFIIAFIISYIADPLVVYFSSKMKRWAASLIVVASIILILVLISFLAAPVIIMQFTEFVKTLPQSFNDFKVWIDTALIPALNSYGIATQEIQDKLSSNLPAKLETIFNAFIGGISGLFTGISIVLASLVNVVLIPFLTFYISKDFNNLKRYVKQLFPHKYQNKASENFHKIDMLLGKYLRGALLVACINAIGATLGLYLIGVKYAFLLGALAGLLDFIPYFGLLISLVLSSIVALLSGNPALQVPLTMLLFISLNLLETSYIAPKMIGERVGLHPAVLILSLLIFNYFFGFVGLLIALPSMSIILMFVNQWFEKRDPAFKDIEKESSSS
jgi:predicted PurR-regulated permease PerM